MKKGIIAILFVGIILLGSFQVYRVIAVNEQEIAEQEIANYLPPFLLMDLSVNITSSSVLSGVNLISQDLEENGWAIAQVKLQASEGKGVITPIRYVDKGEHFEVQSLDTFTVVSHYPTPLEHDVIKIDQAVQSEIAEIGYEDRETGALTAREVLEQYNLVKTQNELAYEIDNFAADELKPKKGKIAYGVEAADTEKLAYHVFTATRDLNETSFLWVADALGLDNTSQIAELNVTTAEIEFKFPYTYRDQLSSGIMDGIYELEIKKALGAVEDTAYNFMDAMKKEQSSLNAKKPKAIRFSIFGIAVVGNGFKDYAIRIGNGFEVPLTTIVIVLGVLMLTIVIVIALLYFTRVKPKREDQKMIKQMRKEQMFRKGLR